MHLYPYLSSNLLLLWCYFLNQIGKLSPGYWVSVRLGCGFGVMLRYGYFSGVMLS